MTEVVQPLFDLMERYAGWLAALAVFSLLTVLGLVAVGAKVLAELPADYFTNPQRRQTPRYLGWFPPLLRPVIPLVKNMLGLLLVAIGVLLLFLPGQGLLTLLAGVMLMEFPGKFRCELWLVRRPQVRRAINWLRRREGQPPLTL